MYAKCFLRTIDAKIDKLFIKKLSISQYLVYLDNKI